MAEAHAVQTPPKMPKWMLNAQVFLLRRKLMGPMNKQLMVITPIGRKSGKRYSVPIGFIHDGNTILTFNVGGTSNWYKNVLANPVATLEIEGKTIEARGEPIKDPQQIAKVYDTYRREQPSIFKRFFGASPDTPTAELMKLGERVVFMRFTPIK